MEVLGIDVRVKMPQRDDESPKLQLKGFVNQTDGVYVEIDLGETIARLILNPKEGVHMLAADLDNGLKTMADIYDRPDFYAASGTITDRDAAAIKFLRQSEAKPS